MTRKRAALWVIATVLVPLLFYWFTSGCYIGTWYARTGHQGSPPPEVLVWSMFVGLPPALCAVIALWWWFHRGKATFAEIYGISSRAWGFDVLMGTALGLLWVAIYGALDVVSWRSMFTLDHAKLASVPASLSAGICEEFLYRGFVFWVLAAAGVSRTSQLLISCLAFGLAHCFWGPWGMLWTALLGLSFGLIVLWRGNVWPAVAAHTLLDLCIEPALIEKAFQGGFYQ